MENIDELDVVLKTIIDDYNTLIELELSCKFIEFQDKVNNAFYKIEKNHLAFKQRLDGRFIKKPY